MIERILLDAHPLSLLAHPNPNAANVPEITQWLGEHLLAGTSIYVSEVADYEVRRELVRAGKVRCIRALDALSVRLNYVPITTAHMRRAAELWAAARNQGIPTASNHSLDADVMLAAQAQSLNAIVATPNVAHLSRFVQASRWRDLQP